MRVFYHLFSSCMTMIVVLKVCFVYSYHKSSIVPAAAIILVGSSALMMLVSEDAGENDDDVASDRVYAYAAQLGERNRCLFTRSFISLPLYHGKV
jgi:hypothetical protein